MLKKAVFISLFIFWAVVVAILVAGLVFYQNHKSSSVNPSVNNALPTPAKNIPFTPAPKVTPPPTPPTGPKTYSVGEVASHNTISDCWMIIAGKIYNLSGYASEHPGGERNIANYCGREATTAFETKGRPSGNNHSDYAWQLLGQYYLGDLAQ